MTESLKRRAGLADFLRTRRARLRPEQFGLPTVPRRHTPLPKGDTTVKLEVVLRKEK